MKDDGKRKEGRKRGKWKGCVCGLWKGMTGMEKEKNNGKGGITDGREMEKAGKGRREETEEENKKYD